MLSIFVYIKSITMLWWMVVVSASREIAGGGEDHCWGYLYCVEVACEIAGGGKDHCLCGVQIGGGLIIPRNTMELEVG